MWYNILYNKKLEELTLYDIRELLVRSEEFGYIKDSRMMNQLMREYLLSFWARWLKDKFSDPRPISEIRLVMSDELKC